MINVDELRKDDRKHLWHPYTDISDFEKRDFPIIERAEGVYLYEEGGKKLLDGISSWWCVNLGHSQPTLIKAIHEQSEKMQHSILGGISHKPVIELSKALGEITPEGLNHSFYCSDGSSAVEASLKMAIQYWTIKGKPNKNRFISLKDGYHGDTLGAIGVGYVDKFHRHFKKNIKSSYRAESPHCAKCKYAMIHKNCNIQCFESMGKLIKKHHKHCAAVIIEPLCQGAAGIRIYRSEYLRKLRVLCDQYNLLLITDEIAVGFGRTGSWFACNKAGISPDIMVLGKGLTGGYLPMSVSICNDQIYNTFRSSPGQDNTFYHGHTFCGNPIISALALKAIELYKEEKVFEKLPEKEIILEKGIAKVASYLVSSYHDSMGMIASLEISDLDGGSNLASEITKIAREKGLFIRPLGSVIYLWPPLISTAMELKAMINILEEAMVEAKNNLN